LRKLSLVDKDQEVLYLSMKNVAICIRYPIDRFTLDNYNVAVK